MKRDAYGDEYYALYDDGYLAQERHENAQKDLKSEIPNTRLSAMYYFIEEGKFDKRVQNIMALDDSEDNRVHLAYQPTLDDGVQTFLAKDPSYKVRNSLLDRKKLALFAAIIIAESNDLNLHEKLLRRENLNWKVQCILARSKSIQVKKNLALSPDLCPEAEEILREDYTPMLQEALNAWQKQLIGCENWSSFEYLEAAQDGNRHVLMHLAGMEGLPSEAQLVILERGDSAILEKLAKLKTLSDDAKLGLAMPNIEESVRKVLVRRDDLCHQAQLVLSLDEEITIKTILAGHKGLVEKAQINLALDSGKDSSEVKLALILNPRLSDECKSQLRLDSDQKVREAAVKKNLMQPLAS